VQPCGIKPLAVNTNGNLAPNPTLWVCTYAIAGDEYKWAKIV
jgi:hypothetical protein